MKLWETENTETESIVEKYTSSRDVKLDQELVYYDIYGNIAHANMLFEQGYITEMELKKINSSLLKLYDSKIEITAEDEDVHSKIESLVTEETKVGEKIHTGRSRNDQILVDLRLYTKKNIIKTSTLILNLIDILVKKGEDYRHLTIPGYTHMRQAMPMTAYLWLTSYAESLLDDLDLLMDSYRMNDQNPLGAAAGYGTSLNIDRERTTDLLDFSRTQNNPLYCINSRGKIEYEVISVLSQLMLDLEKFSNDLILFSTHEFDFIDIPKDFCTGSSIMPQKTNPDVLEILKGRTAKVISNQHQIELVLKNSNLGYNREIQETKESLMESIEITKNSVEILSKLIPRIKFNEESIKKNMKESTFAGYTANKMVEKGIPFREAYRRVKENGDYEKIKKEGYVDYHFDKKELEQKKYTWEEKKKQYSEMIKVLLSMAERNSI